MKILLPTNLTALSLAKIKMLLPKLVLKKDETEVILFHVAEDSNYNDLLFDKVDKVLMVEASRKLAEVKETIFTEFGINVTTIIKDGFFKKELRETVAAVAPDLVVLLSKSKYGQKSANFIGAVDASLLIVPKNIDLNGLSRMGLAINKNESPTVETLWKIKSFADYLNCEVKLFHVADGNNTEREFYQNIASVIGFGEIEIIKKENVLEGINAWTKKNKIDVLVTLTHTKGFFERLTTNSVTKDLVIENQISLLVITQ